MALQQQREAIDDAIEALPPDLALLLGALRGEFAAGLSSVKAWGCAALLGGGTLGGAIGAFLGPHAVQQPIRESAAAFVRALPFL